MKNLLQQVLGLSLVSFMLHSNAMANPEIVSEDVWVVDSDLADYDGKECTLTGHVTVEHELGTLAAHQAILDPAALSSKNKSKNLQFIGDVVLNLKEGGRLTCAKADVNYQTLCGNFFGDLNNPVVYADAVGQQGKQVLIKGSQMKMTVDPNKKQNSEKSSKGNVREIAIDGNVVIDYTGLFVANSDHAFYKRHEFHSDTAEQNSAFVGIITLQGTTPENQCRVETMSGDLIKAQKITIDTSTKQLAFSYPRGRMNTSQSDQKPIHFVADKLLWDDPSSLLTLQGHVQVSQGNLGNLDAENEVRLFRHVDNEQKGLSSIESVGKTILSYANEDKNLDHSLTCYGSIKVDHVKMEAWLFSPKNGNGEVEENNQIYFDDIKGEIFANKAFIKYEIVNKEVVPSKIILGGNVRILNTLSRQGTGTSNAIQYALADQVEYVPHSSEMLFKSNAGRRVLFFDKTNNLQVSAPSLKIIRGAGVEKEKVQGYGDVRFSFIEHEFEQIRKRFAFDKQNSVMPLK